MAIFEAATSEQIWEIFQDEEYHKVVVPDEEKFLDKSYVCRGFFAIEYRFANVLGRRSVAFPAEIVSIIDKSA